jgi:chemotaxis protein MotA
MDIATLLGIISAFGLVIIAIALGSGISLFINIPSLMIVAGGTLGTTMINYPMKDMLGIFTVLKNVFLTNVIDINAIPVMFIEFATRARREGILALESLINDIDDPFLQKGMQLAIDGLEPATIKHILETDINVMNVRHTLGAEIFATMAAYAPALGMIGTLIGLVQMLQSMDDPSSIGPAMAVALLTTFYGSVMANLIFLPIAGKLKKRSQEETIIKEMIVDGIVAITNGDNPRIVEQKLMVYMVPNKRESSFRA